MDPSELARVRSLAGKVAGVSLDDVSPAEMQRVLRDAGLPFETPRRSRSCCDAGKRSSNPPYSRQPRGPETSAFLVVDPVFGAAMDRLGARASDPAALAAEPARVRVIVATRLIDGLVDNGGWAAVFTEGMQGIVPLAIDGPMTISRTIPRSSHSGRTSRRHGSSCLPRRSPAPSTSARTRTSARLRL
jgi:hypothetical protein